VRIVRSRSRQLPERLVPAREQEGGDLVRRHRVVGDGQARDRRDGVACWKVPTPVQPAQAPGDRPGQQEGVGGGDAHEVADVVAAREVPEQLQRSSPEPVGPASVRGHVAEHVLMPMVGRGFDRRGGHRGDGAARPGFEEPVQVLLRERIQRGPGLGQLAQRCRGDTGRGSARGGLPGDRPGEPHHERPGSFRCQQAGVHGLASQPQSLPSQHRIEPVHQLLCQALGVVHISHADPADGLVEQFARGFAP
jgi:hypothetical protein